MATKELTAYTFKSPVRAGFCNIVAPRQFQDKGKGKGDPRYDASFILEPDSEDLKTLKALVIAEAKAMFPGKRLKPGRLTQEQVDAGDWVEIAVPWKDGTRAADRAKEEGKDQEFFRGKIILKASSKYAPALSGIENGKIVDYTDPNTRATLDKVFYSGAYMAPHVALHAYKAKDDKPGGVGLYLNAVIFIKDGPRLGGNKVNAAEVFKAYAGTVSSIDPGANEADALDDL